MKSISRLFLVPLISLTFAGLSFAQATPATPEKKMERKAEKPKVSRITGELASVDGKAGTLTVKVKDKEMSFTAETKSAKSALGKVKAGDKVSVSYTEKDGKLIASSVAAAKVKSETKGTTKAAEKKEGTNTGTK